MSFFEALFQNPSVQWVVLGTVGLAVLGSSVGTFNFLQKRSLIGDAVSHALLPGICLAFILKGNKDPLALLVGAFISGWIALLVIDLIQSKSKTKSDTAIAIVLSGFFGLGIVFLTLIQSSENANQAGLDAFLFGNAASIQKADLLNIAMFGSFILLSLFLGFRAFKALCFDKDFIAAGGFRVKLIQFWLSSITVLTICLGVQALGVVLMAALLITPAVAARAWTNKLGNLIFLSSGIGIISGFVGAWISYESPSMPTGPWVVLTASAIVLVSLVFSPKRGVVPRYFRQKANQKKIQSENILKALFHLEENSETASTGYSLKDLLSMRAFQRDQLVGALKALVRKNLLLEEDGTYSLSSLGRQKAGKVVRNHRLWELYLTQYVGMEADHVHEDAEAMEHLITPELEKELSKVLNHPEYDPHQRQIPGKHD